MRIAAGVEYDGSDFCGWQSQRGVRTVQECVEQAISRVADHPVRVVCAGRTDTGVHALGQVIHFDTRVERSMRSWVLGSNVRLPSDVSLLWARPVDERFHARFSAISRRYRYVIFDRWVRPTGLRTLVTWQKKPLNESLMQQAAKRLEGEHDFSTFRALACQAKSPVRTVFELVVSRCGDCVYIDIHANAFLYHMVRNIAGVLMTVGRGEQPVEWVSHLLSLRDRNQGGVTAPAAGLHLVGVEYEASFSLQRNIRLPVFA